MVVFACQRDSLLREYSTTVVSCRPASFDLGDGRGERSVYEVVCEDTILFPEGGGQPSDVGEMNSVPVVKVLRRGAEAVHYVEDQIVEGSSVKQTVDWKRRFDHMQQHSGQHLLTAIADASFGWVTTSWWLGETISHIELDTTSLTEEKIARLEEIVNEKIRQSLPVTATVLTEADCSNVDDTRARGLPKDHVGDVRIVTIATIEANMCCGTHVTNTAELQSIKLLGFEKGKKGKTNLRFLVGGRVLSHLERLHKRELELNLLLKNGPDLHVQLVDKLIKSNKTTSKSLQTVLRTVATLEIARFKAITPKPRLLHNYLATADIDYVNFFIRELSDLEVLLLVAVGEGSESLVVLSGPPELVQSLGPRVVTILEGKGNGKGSRFQAKVKSLAKWLDAVQLCMEELKTKEN